MGCESVADLVENPRTVTVTLIRFAPVAFS